MNTRPVSRFVAALALGAALLGGCGGDGTDVDCNLNSCTVTMDRGVEAQANILGADIKLIAVENGQVTLEVEGNRVSVPVDANGGTQVAGLSITVQEVTDSKVVLQVTQA